MFREKFIDMCVKYLEKDLAQIPSEILSQEQYEGLLSMLWDNQAFRNYVKERNQKIIYSIAGIAGSEPEPRDKTRLLLGQRVENLVLASKAKACATKRDNRIKERKLKEESKPILS